MPAPARQGNEVERMTGFSNRPVAAADLPRYHEAEMTPACKGFLHWSLLVSLLFWGVLALIAWGSSLLEFMPNYGMHWPTGVLLGLAALSVPHAVLDARYRAWGLREHDLIYRHGVIWRKIIVVPFARVQHVTVSHGPLERRFGIMRLKCFTAGGMSTDLTALGLDAEAARRVRQYLLEQIATSADSGPGDVGSVMATEDHG